MTYSATQLQLTHVLQQLYRRLGGKVTLATGGAVGTVIDTKLEDELADANEDDQVVCVVDTVKAAIDVECWHDGVVHVLIAEPGATLPVGTLLYLVIPDIIPFVVDDAAVIGLGMTLFVELCPEYVVQEHMRALRAYKPPETGSKSGPPTHSEEDILEGEFREADDSTSHPKDGQE